jgi:hypothetical protein
MRCVRSTSFHTRRGPARRWWKTRFTEYGVEQSPISDQPGYSVLVLRDPDNIQLELMSAG